MAHVGMRRDGASWIAGTLRQHTDKQAASGVSARLISRDRVTRRKKTDPKLNKSKDNYKDIPHGVATLYSELPEDTKSTSLGQASSQAELTEGQKFRVRYSGAARLRYKRKLQRLARQKAIHTPTHANNESANALEV